MAQAAQTELCTAEPGIVPVTAMPRCCAPQSVSCKRGQIRCVRSQRVQQVGERRVDDDPGNDAPCGRALSAQGRHAEHTSPLVSIAAPAVAIRACAQALRASVG